MGDMDGQIETYVYDIHAKNRMYTRSIFTKINDDEKMLIHNNPNNVPTKGGDNVVYDIRLYTKGKKWGKKFICRILHALDISGITMCLHRIMRSSF